MLLAVVALLAVLAVLAVLLLLTLLLLAGLLLAGLFRRPLLQFLSLQERPFR